MEQAAAPIDRRHPDPATLERYYKAQRELRIRLAGRQAPPRPIPPNPVEPDPRWLITDLVTLGCPLTHAEFLLAADARDLRNRIIARELPESPPFREDLDPKVLKIAQATGKLPIASPPENSTLISYPDPVLSKVWHLHHAAPFSVVRWINIYDPARLVFFGDIIGGPLANVFGPAIIDVDLKRRRGGRQSWCFTHTKYWSLNGEKKHIEALRAAVDLLDKPNSNPNAP